MGRSGFRAIFLHVLIVISLAAGLDEAPGGGIGRDRGRERDSSRVCSARTGAGPLRPGSVIRSTAIPRRAPRRRAVGPAAALRLQAVEPAARLAEAAEMLVGVPLAAAAPVVVALMVVQDADARQRSAAARSSSCQSSWFCSG